MTDSDNAIALVPVTARLRRGVAAGPHGRVGTGLRRRVAPRALPPGLALGSLGILGFSFSLPATRLAVAGLDPWLVAFGRATVAAALSAVYLAATRAPRPTSAQARSLAVVACGVVIGFPLLTSLACVAATQRAR